MIQKDILIEDLVRIYPASVKYLMEKGIKCLACGEPIWGTLAEACQENDLGDTEIEEVVRELNDLLKAETET